MRTILILFLGVSIFTSCKEEGVSPYSLDSKEVNGQWIKFLDGKPYTGLIVHYDDGNYLREKGQMVEGRPSGIWYYYDYNEEVETEKTYDNDGDIQEEIHYYTSNGNEGKIDYKHHYYKEKKEQIIVWYDWCGEAKRKKVLKLFDEGGKLERYSSVSDEKLKGCD